MALSRGARVGPYEVLDLLGAGGMGEVWRARDPRLGRDVALKVLPADLAHDPERRERLEREARAASALNHPNIVTVHELGEVDGFVYLVLELIQGRSLRDLMKDGPLPMGRLLDLASQTAEGLAKAHAAGIVHRDLKPDNVMVTDEGVVKILDFGLARKSVVGKADLSAAPTEAQLTSAGAVVGTLSYMAPEQASGQKVDHRSDQFSLGAMLHELATGRRAFARATPRETLAAVLQEHPEPIRQLHPAAPEELQRILERCLAKDSEGRYASTKDLARDLRNLRDRTNVPGEGGETRSSHPGPPSRRRVAVGVLALVAVLLALSAWLLRGRLRPAATPRIESLAVLPLANLSRDPEQDYFADGMTEALITDLAKIGSLRVTSRTSAMQYKGTSKPLPQIARELGVDAIVEGSVQRVAGQVKITAQLIHGATDHHLWAESYERDLRDVLALQNEVARSIAREVAAKLTPDEQTRLSRPRPVAPEVYEIYLRGLHSYNKRTEAGMREAIELFQRGIALDPGYAPAHLGVCRTYSNLGYTGWGALAPREAMPRVQAACHEALRLDDTLGEAHALLGASLAYYEWDRAAAEASFARALSIGPSDQVSILRYAWFLSHSGRHDEALAQSEDAVRLDPLSLSAFANHGWLLYWARRYDRAAEQFAKALALHPEAPVPNLMLGIVHVKQGNHTQAIIEIERAYRMSGSTGATLAQMAHVYAVVGRGAEARRALRGLEERARHEYVASYWIAMVHHGLGQNDEAMARLEKAYEDREALPLLDVEPRWDGLRTDPRFRDLQRRVGFRKE